MRSPLEVVPIEPGTADSDWDHLALGPLDEWQVGFANRVALDLTTMAPYVRFGDRFEKLLVYDTERRGERGWVGLRLLARGAVAQLSLSRRLVSGEVEVVGLRGERCDDAAHYASRELHLQVCEVLDAWGVT